MYPPNRFYLIKSMLSFGAVLLTFLLIMCETGLVSSQAQGSPQKRELNNRIPPHLPLKVEVKNLNSENWTQDLEIEVKNSSDKPIYLLDLFLTLPEIKTSDGYPVGFALRYGRIQLVDYTTPLQPEDVPIQPGETHTFKITEAEAKGW